MQYFWYQLTGGEDAWKEARSESRAKILAEKRPAFVTVLDASVIPEPGWGREQYDEVKYGGPFYVDWDAETLEEAIKGFHLFLAKLGEMDVDLRSLRMYATGGRGFHLEIPEQVFMPKVSKTGVTHLPAIYKEMAYELFVETMDMRVYTGRRGRMWRTCGVQRSNGKYKVPLTVEEATGMTLEMYDDLCSEPRLEPYRTEPVLNDQLATLYSKCLDRVKRGVANRPKAAKDLEALAHFKGEFPATLRKVMSGEGLADGVGFNRVAMQIAITANALGKSAEETLRLSQGLIANHSGDSSRYSSPGKRRRALEEAIHYTSGNDAYNYSVGGIRSLLAPGVGSSDLDGVSPTTAGFVPDNVDDLELSEEAEQAFESAENSLYDGISILKTGIWRRTGDGYRKLSNLAFVAPSVMKDSDDGKTLGIEADLLASERRCGRHLVTTRTFLSRTALSSYCAGHGGTFVGSDTQASVVGLILQEKAIEMQRTIYVVRREGLDLIQDPVDRSKVQLDQVWVSPDSVLTHREDLTYRYQPLLGTNTVYHTDVHLCTPMTNSEDSRLWVHQMLNMNSPTVVAQMLGWFVSCLHKQHYQRAFDQFPLLHPNGPAGSGKTMTTNAMARLFHNTGRPYNLSASHSSPFPFKHAWASSASVPFIIDEYKPSEMQAQRVDFLLSSFRLAYNQAHAGMAGINRGAADSSFRDVTEFAMAAPTVFLGESQETQTAVVQRSVPIAINPDDSGAHTKSFQHVMAHIGFMPQLGRALLGMTMGIMGDDGRWVVQPETVESRAAALRPTIDKLRESLHTSVHDRQVYNLAVVIEGLTFLDRTLQAVFGDEFRDTMERLRQTIYDNKADLQTAVMSEAAKVVNDMALISRTEPEDGELAMREGFEYVVTDGHIDLMLRESFVKYFAWCKRKGFQPLYANPDAFIAAMGKFPPLVNKLCLDSPLRKSAQSRIFRFSIPKLAAEGIEQFRSKATD